MVLVVNIVEFLFGWVEIVVGFVGVTMRAVHSGAAVFDKRAVGFIRIARVVI